MCRSRRTALPVAVSAHHDTRRMFGEDLVVPLGIAEHSVGNRIQPGGETMSNTEVVQIAEPVRITVHHRSFRSSGTSPDDDRMSWQLERIHFADPLTAMDCAFMAECPRAAELGVRALRAAGPATTSGCSTTVGTTRSSPSTRRRSSFGPWTSAAEANVAVAADRLETRGTTEWLPDDPRSTSPSGRPSIWPVRTCRRSCAHFEETVDPLSGAAGRCTSCRRPAGLRGDELSLTICIGTSSVTRAPLALPADAGVRQRHVREPVARSGG